MSAEAARYPEIGFLGESSYCNPFFGLRLPLPGGWKARRLHFPVQSGGRHVLLALRYLRLGRPAELYVTAFPDASAGAARLAAAAHRLELSKAGASSAELREIAVGGHPVQRLRAEINVRDGNELDFYLDARGWVVRFEVHTLDGEMEAALASGMERLTLTNPSAGGACPEAPLYYGPALPTDLVAERIAQQPGRLIPEGELRGREYIALQLGLRVMLPERWQTLSAEERERLPELLAEPGGNRRHELLRACSRVLFGTYDPLIEPVSGVHPALVVAAMPRGCVPGLEPPAPGAPADALNDFAQELLDGLGFTAEGQWKLHSGDGMYSLIGAMPYRVPREAMSRRLTVRVSATVRGEALLLLYSVTTSPSGQRELDRHIFFAAVPSRP